MYQGFVTPYIPQQYEPPVPSFANLASAMSKVITDDPVSKKEKGKSKESADKEYYGGTSNIADGMDNIARDYIATASRMQALYGKLDYANNPMLKEKEMEFQANSSLSAKTAAEQNKAEIEKYREKIIDKGNGDDKSGDISGDYSMNLFLDNGEVKTFGDVLKGLYSVNDYKKQQDLIKRYQINNDTLAGTGDFIKYVQSNIKEFNPKDFGQKSGGGSWETVSPGEIEMGSSLFMKSTTNISKNVDTNEKAANKAFYSTLENMTPEAKQGLFSMMANNNRGAFVMPGTKAGNIEVKAINEPITSQNLDKYFIKQKNNALDAASVHDDMIEAEESGTYTYVLRPEYTLRNADGSANQQATGAAMTLLAKSIIGQEVNRTRMKDVTGGGVKYDFLKIGEANENGTFATEYPELAEDQSDYVNVKNDAFGLISKVAINEGTAVPYLTAFNTILNGKDNSINGQLLKRFFDNASSDDFSKLNGMQGNHYKEAAQRIKEGKGSSRDAALLLQLVAGNDVLDGKTDGHKYRYKADAAMSDNINIANEAAKAITERVGVYVESYETPINEKLKKGIELSDDEKRWVKNKSNIYLPKGIGSLNNDYFIVKNNEATIENFQQSLPTIDMVQKLVDKGVINGNSVKDWAYIGMNNVDFSGYNVKFDASQISRVMTNVLFPNSRYKTESELNRIRLEQEARRDKITGLVKLQKQGKISNAQKVELARLKQLDIQDSKISGSSATIKTKMSPSDFAKFAQNNEVTLQKNIQLNDDEQKIVSAKSLSLFLNYYDNLPKEQKYKYTRSEMMNKFRDQAMQEVLPYKAFTNDPNSPSKNVKWTDADGQGDKVKVGDVEINQTAQSLLNARYVFNKEKPEESYVEFDTQLNLSAFGSSVDRNVQGPTKNMLYNTGKVSN